MTTRIQNLSDLQDRRIMMEKKLPAFGYALILLVAFLMVFLVIWSTQNKRTYVSQSTGSVQAANKTYIMSSYSGSITELNISEGSYVTEGDLIAHIKSTDLDIQQDSYQKQLDIYKKQKSQYEKLLIGVTGGLIGRSIERLLADLALVALVLVVIGLVVDVGLAEVVLVVLSGRRLHR